MTQSAKDDLNRLTGSAHAMASWQHAQQYLRNGQHAAAVTSYRSLIQQFPNLPILRIQMGMAAAGELDFAKANQAFQRALELAPTDANVVVSAGVQYFQLRNMKEACACFERAVEMAPESVQACLHLASCLEKSHRLDEAWECIETYLAQNPKDGQAIYFKAFLLHRKGLNSEVETVLYDLLESDPLPSLEVQANACHLLGMVLDGFDQYADALRYFDKSKALKRQTAKASMIEQTEQAYEKAIEGRRRLLAELTPETMRRWREDAAPAPCPHSLALLGGAARSGTTLIEQILGAHPEVLIFDEPMAFAKEVVGPLQHSALRLNFKSLNGLAPAGRTRLMERYFKNLLHEVEEAPGARLLLDKNPSTTASLHVWLRLFPLSKVIIALRDPRDVIISCYFRNTTADEFNFVSRSSLERTARDYTDCMDVWLRLREIGGFEWIETRYEDVVGNLEGEGRRLMNFLGLPWHEAQATYYDTARRRFVHSPTYHEVKQPIYNRAVGRWKYYAEALAPLQTRLEPYFRAFGYG